MKMTIDMPFVSGCTVSECAYNINDSCRAHAITVGDGVHPGCDTFLGAPRHARNSKQSAGVGACKVTGCMHNEDYECVADSIRVGLTADTVNCLTYMGR